MPERFLNLYFQTLGVPYRAFQAENPGQVADAIGEIDKLERYPMIYVERIPRRDLTGLAYAMAGFFILVLVAGKLLEVNLVTRSKAPGTIVEAPA
jgi:mxaC protein